MFEDGVLLLEGSRARNCESKSNLFKSALHFFFPKKDGFLDFGFLSIKILICQVSEDVGEGKRAFGAVEGQTGGWADIFGFFLSKAVDRPSGPIIIFRFLRNHRSTISMKSF